MSLKGEIFIDFLPQKFMTKYGIGSTYSVTFVSQKILGCLQCFSTLSISGPLTSLSRGVSPVHSTIVTIWKGKPSLLNLAESEGPEAKLQQRASSSNNRL